MRQRSSANTLKLEQAPVAVGVARSDFMLLVAAILAVAVLLGGCKSEKQREAERKAALAKKRAALLAEIDLSTAGGAGRGLCLVLTDGGQDVIDKVLGTDYFEKSTKSCTSARRFAAMVAGGKKEDVAPCILEQEQKSFLDFVDGFQASGSTCEVDKGDNWSSVRITSYKGAEDVIDYTSTAEGYRPKAPPVLVEAQKRYFEDVLTGFAPKKPKSAPAE